MVSKMKTHFVILATLIILESAVAHTAFREAGLSGSPDGNYLLLADSIKKRVPPMFPHKPAKPATPARKPLPPLGTVKVTTEVPSILYFNGDSAANMTRYHLVVIYRVPVGSHTLSFRDKSMESSKTIIVDSGTTGYYRLRIDTTISDSIVRGRFEMGRSAQIVSRYEPFKHAVCFELLPGFYFNGQGFGFNARFLVSYKFNRKLKLGVGSGYALYPTSFRQKTYELFSVTGTFRSERTYLSFVPVYLNIALTSLKNRTTTYLSFDLGLSFPLTRSVSCKSTYSGQSNYIQTGAYTLEVDNINTGFYGGLTLGMKYFFSPVFEGGISLGFNTFINDCQKLYYKNDAQPWYSSQYKYMSAHATTGFGFNLTLGINLATKK